MNEVLQRLAEVIKKSSKIVFLGVGSPLRSDDNLGNRIVAALEEKLTVGPGREVHFYQGESAPENFTGAIRAVSPEYLILFDAAELGKPPGAFGIIDPDQVEGIGFASHVLPLKIIGNYLKATVGREIIMVGVQPQSLEFGERLSPAVTEAIDEFVTKLIGRLD
jgi:hydrogenase 3 maturation protease